MSQTQVHRLGDLQLEILKVLWQRDEASVAQVHEQLPNGADLAHTTVATMLRKMEARGLASHRTDGRTFVYRAAVAEDQVSQGMAEHVFDRIFEGRLADLVSHLLTAREVSPDELARLEHIIAQRKRQP